MDDGWRKREIREPVLQWKRHYYHLLLHVEYERFVGYDGVSSARHIHELRAQGDHFYDNDVDNKWLESLMEAVGQ